jgi:hypothetical protein
MRMISVLCNVKCFSSRFPPKNSGEEYNGIQYAVKMAQAEFANSSIIDFGNFHFDITAFYTNCTSDEVLTKFIQFYAKRRSLLGVLGPACSAAIEPIAAISRHYHLSVTTYSAEGIVLDRENYPYFYRTIGECLLAIFTCNTWCSYHADI